jgi:hypothetical protein
VFQFRKSSIEFDDVWLKYEIWLLNTFSGVHRSLLSPNLHQAKTELRRIKEITGH